MFGSYYKNRWQLFINFLTESLNEGEDFDSAAFDLVVREIDYAWTRSSEKYPTSAFGDPIAEAFRVRDKYRRFFERR